MEAGYKDIPHIYVLLDNFAVFKELYAEKYEDDFLFLAREGITYGISLIVTASTTGGFGYKYMSNFANHIALSCNDTAEYSNLFDRCKVEPNNTPGRMLISYNKAIYEAQSYLSFSGEKEIERVDAIRQFVEKENIKNNGMHAKLIPEVPDDLSLTYIAKNFNVDPSRQIAVSLSYQHVEPVCFDINATPQLALIGKNTSNMIGFEKALIHDMKENYFDRPAELFIIDSLTRDLKDYAEEAFVTDYSIDYSRLSVIFEHIMGELEDRYNTVLEDGLETLERLPLIVILINNFSAIEFISGSKELMSMYNTIVSKYKAMKIMMIFGGIGDENIGYSSPELLKKIKENKHAVIFSNAADHKVFDIPMPFIRQNKKPIDATQAYYLKENETVKIRFAKGE